MIIRNMHVFTITKGWTMTPAQLAEKLASRPLQPCSALERSSQGWVPQGDGQMVLTTGNVVLACYGMTAKILPGSVIRQERDKRAKEMEEQQGFKPGRKQLKDIFDAVEAELLPIAFQKTKTTNVIFDLDNGWMIVDAGSASTADGVIELLKVTLGELPLTLFKTRQAPGTAMTSWLLQGEIPGAFSIDQDCELRNPGEAAARVKYIRQPLEGEDARRLINTGRIVDRMAITWNDRLSFVLTEQMHIKRVQFLDVVKEQAEQAGEGADSPLLADFIIVAGEVRQMLQALSDALGGSLSEIEEDIRCAA
jgi:recombination associated protein RdgC